MGGGSSRSSNTSNVTDASTTNNFASYGDGGQYFTDSGTINIQSMDADVAIAGLDAAGTLATSVVTMNGQNAYLAESVVDSALSANQHILGNALSFASNTTDKSLAQSSNISNKMVDLAAAVKTGSTVTAQNYKQLMMGGLAVAVLFAVIKK